MTKVVIDVRDDSRNNGSGLAKPVLKGVMAGLWSILIPPRSTQPRYRETWCRRVDNGRWVKVWLREY
jgi:hypothetical protein